jgi:hypothetical protein
MVMRPEEFHAHAMLAADEEGRLPLSRMAGWEVFPFEQDGAASGPAGAAGAPGAAAPGGERAGVPGLLGRPCGGLVG